ncbi:hypothetical protein BC939DRAFT_454786 [Gamsiella multidivaricata]|uniref:uncharacterized protein n=1 Tax=Gamsiella multidivaricata TaxID=101098 RepID=UPI0022204519|nr:uncharacterized protein BC939DRAFT_454786 [Gamsiella multidivaricata]KAG0357776.1 hypothetical protein BGZ54_000191 [Gamsiella multidivaricata]KAI7821885.1 hypothetical protein BC939DRAFT_454786 [Gamsiella multidivaricata]
MEFFFKYHREPRTEKEREALYGRIRQTAYWLDSFATVGGLNVGLEAIVGFIPVIGDFLGLFASLYQVYLCYLFRIPLHLMMRMLVNIMIDFVVGLIPWIGDILDIFYKSNQYNLTILTNWLHENRLVDVHKYNREHPLGNGTEPSGRAHTRSRAAASGIGIGGSRF